MLKKSDLLKVHCNQIEETKYVPGCKNGSGNLTKKFRDINGETIWVKDAETPMITVGNIVSNTTGNGKIKTRNVYNNKLK